MLSYSHSVGEYLFNLVSFFAGDIIDLLGPAHASVTPCQSSCSQASTIALLLMQGGGYLITDISRGYALHGQLGLTQVVLLLINAWFRCVS